MNRSPVEQILEGSVDLYGPLENEERLALYIIGKLALGYHLERRHVDDIELLDLFTDIRDALKEAQHRMPNGSAKFQDMVG